MLTHYVICRCRRPWRKARPRNGTRSRSIPGQPLAFTVSLQAASQQQTLTPKCQNELWLFERDGMTWRCLTTDHGTCVTMKSHRPEKSSQWLRQSCRLTTRRSLVWIPVFLCVVCTFSSFPHYTTSPKTFMFMLIIDSKLLLGVNVSVSDNPSRMCSQL